MSEGTQALWGHLVELEATQVVVSEDTEPGLPVKAGSIVDLGLKF